MFNDIGRKVKGLAKFICVVGIILSVISGIIIIAGGNAISSYSYGYSRSAGGSSVLLGIIVAAVGSLVSWIGAWVTYAIGEAADNAAHNRCTLEALEKKLERMENKQ